MHSFAQRAFCCRVRIDFPNSNHRLSLLPRSEDRAREKFGVYVTTRECAATLGQRLGI